MNSSSDSDRPGLQDRNVLADVAWGVINRHDPQAWDVRPDGFWCRVEPKGGQRTDQGWKLHVSATPLSAPLVLARAAEVLVAHGSHFKFAASMDEVAVLVSAQTDRGSGGKFITVYPRSDDEFTALARDLHRVTQGLPGPQILSDRQWCSGSLVYFRYGVFSRAPELTDDGSFESMLIGPDGERVKDERRAWFSAPAWAKSPVADGKPVTARAKPAGVLLADRFEVTQAIKHSYKGGVYRAYDRVSGDQVLIKQARPHVGSTLLGTDARDLLRHEADMLDLLAPAGVTPDKRGSFEQQDSVFLVAQFVPGMVLRAWVHERTEPDPSLGLAMGHAVSMARQLVGLMAAAHDAGVVLRDFNPNNIMVTPEGVLRLVDLEHAARPGDFTCRAFTPAYGAPEYVSSALMGPAPGTSVDLFSLGATLFYLVSGVNPALPGDTPEARPLRERLESLVSLVAVSNVVLRSFAPLILALADDDPAQRWSLERVRDYLDALACDSDAPSWAPPLPRLPHDRLAVAEQERLISDGLNFLLRTMTPDNVRLWAETSFGERTDPVNVQQGAAGVLAVLTRAAEIYGEEHLRAGVRSVANWIDQRRLAIPRLLPGLYFGRSGTAWAMHDAARSIGDQYLAERAVDLAKAVPLAWANPDICHGTAGAGMAHLHLWQSTGDTELLSRATRCADAVLAAARERDEVTLWPIPADAASSLAGLAHYGFAHGVAGAGAFLLTMALATGQEGYLDGARKAGSTLAATARVDGDAASWPSGPDSPPAATQLWHWCSGSSGIGTFLVRLWRVTGEERFLGLANGAAAEVRRRRWRAGSAACHGLAGDGEFLLDLADFTGEAEYRAWAQELAAAIHARNGLRDGLMVVGAENPLEITAGYNTGLAGVIGFLLRLRHGGARWWMVDQPIVNAVSGTGPRIEAGGQ